jgi:sialidase-1
MMVASVAMGEDAINKVDLFHQNDGRHALCRIPGMVVTAKGTILVYCEGRIGSGSDWAESEVLMRRSTDGGTSWDEARVIGNAPKDAQHSKFARRKGNPPAGFTTNNPLMIAARDGVVHFFYCTEYARCFYRTSTDDGATFSEPIEITKTFDGFRDRYDWGVIATGPGHGIELKNGRLLVPIWMSTGANGHSPSCIGTIYSDDAGKTWHTGDIVAGGPVGLLENPSENILVELSDGRVMMSIRHNSQPHARAVTTSPDGATQWSKIRLDEQLPDPICMASLVRSDAKTILFSNPNNNANRDRKNLTIRASHDDGATWPTSRTLELGPSGYSDLAVGKDGEIYCFYERGEKKAAEKLTFARFNMAWLNAK